MKPCPKDVICIDGNFRTNPPQVKVPIKEGRLYRALSIDRIFGKDYYKLEEVSGYFAVIKFADLDDVNIENSLKEIHEQKISETTHS